MKIYNKISLFEKIEDWFLNHKAVKDKHLKDIYFSWCRLWNKFTGLYYYGPKNFIIGVWAFKSYLWNHHWFDYYYLLDLLRIKLRYDAKHYRKYGIAVNSSKYASQMEQCCDIIDRMIKNEYEDKLFELLDKIDKNWDIHYSLKNGIFRNYNNKLSEDEKSFINDERKKAYKEVDKLRQADTKKLFKIMSDNIWSWWD